MSTRNPLAHCHQRLLEARHGFRCRPAAGLDQPTPRTQYLEIPATRRRSALKLISVAGALYVVLPFLIFDFSSAAVPYDEETFATRAVAIGPRPRWWVPFAARSWDVPGGADFEPAAWPFVVWKPLCLAFDHANGYALPAAWR